MDRFDWFIVLSPLLWIGRDWSMISKEQLGANAEKLMGTNEIVLA